MSFEEWWNTKDYPVSCKGNCKEAYEAGMKADVHTDNSAVIAELENKIADIKANCDLAIEGRDIKIKELEKENEELRNNGFTVSAMTEQQLKVALEKGEQLEKENAELKAEIENDRDLPTVAYMQGAEKQKKKDEKQLVKAKELIENIIRVTWGEGWNYSLDWKVNAEQFLNSKVEK